MRCIWQMDGDKVKGFKCEFSPIDMLMIVSGLKYIVADVERHPKDRERAQGIYNQIMLCRYYDEADCKTEPTISKMEQVDKDINVRSKDEPQTIKVGMATDSVTGKVLGVTLDTDCAWK